MPRKPSRRIGVLYIICSVFLRIIDFIGDADFLLSVGQRGVATFLQGIVDYAWIALLLFGVYWLARGTPNGGAEAKAQKFQWPLPEYWRVLLGVGLTTFVSGLILAASFYPTVGFLAVKAGGVYAGQCRVVLDGSRLAKYAKEYKVALICGRVDTTKDQMDNEKISVSNAFGIKAEEITIDTPPPPDGKTGIWFKVLLLPQNITPAQIKTLRDVETLGGTIFVMR